MCLGLRQSQSQSWKVMPAGDIIVNACLKQQSGVSESRYSLWTSSGLLSWFRLHLLLLIKNISCFQVELHAMCRSMSQTVYGGEDCGLGHRRSGSAGLYGAQRQSDHQDQRRKWVLYTLKCFCKHIHCIYINL